MFPSLSNDNANGNESLSGNSIILKTSSSGKYFKILFLFTIVIQILSSKSAWMKIGLLSAITGSRFGIVFVVISFVSTSIYPIWFLGESVNQIFPLLSIVRNIVANPLNE